jgi:carotenoid cleavage dioxygenase-like enzyme
VIVLDAMHSDNFEANESLSDIFNAKRLRGGEFRRYRIDMAKGSLSYEVMSPTNSEFPTFNLARACVRHEATYSACSVENGNDSFFNGIQRVGFDGEIQLNTLDPGSFGSEPLFAPSKGSDSDDDGYLLEVVYDAHEHSSSLMVFPARDISEPVAILRLRHHLPHQFHGFWHDKVLLNDAR